MIKIEQVKKVKARLFTHNLLSLLQQAIKAARVKVPREKKVLTLVFVSDREIAQLNSAYRRKNKPTDVLSFSYLKQADSEILGEIVISYSTLKRQAQQYQVSLKEETELLFVHGVLHILGFDHEKPRDFKRMLALEQKVLGDKAGLISRSTAVQD